MGAIVNFFGRAYDEVLLTASPRRYRIRQHWRRMDNDPDYRTAVKLALGLRGYRASGESGSKTPWRGAGGSADAEILTALPNLRNRSRELNQDDSLGSGLTKTFVSNVIGTGMVAQAQTDSPEKNKGIEAVWRERRDQLSQADGIAHSEAQRLILRKVLEDGDVLRKAVFSYGDPVWFETIEAERLATPPGKLNDSRLRDGVERDAAGRPVAYWINRVHPGDGIAVMGSGPDNFDRIEAAYVRHLKVTDRPGQTRGVPMFHAILQDLRDLDLLMVAALKRTQIAACLSVFIKSTAETDEMLEVTADKYGYRLDQQLEPGMIFKLYPNESIETLVPNFPIPELEPFVVMLARRIGAALGVSWQIVLKDFSKANYSSARTDLLESRQTFQILQSWFIERYLNWEWEMVMFDAWLHGDPRLAGCTREELAMVRWIPNGWRWVDPEKEAAAAEIELRIGSTTLRDICAAKGDYWEDNLRQRLIEEKRELDMRKEMGLPPKVAEEKPKPAAAPKQEDDNAQAA